METTAFHRRGQVSILSLFEQRNRQFKTYMSNNKETIQNLHVELSVIKDKGMHLNKVETTSPDICMQRTFINSVISLESVSPAVDRSVHKRLLNITVASVAFGPKRTPRNFRTVLWRLGVR